MSRGARKSEGTCKFAKFAQLLLEWFSENRRDFPWREANDPYKILIAEIFLRKTNAQKVSTVYEHFVRKYPTFDALVNADAREVEEFLRPLGLYRRRTKDLIDVANTITTEHHGEVPCSREQLLRLPGVGDYIANAVLCFAFGEAVPLVDTNVGRVVTRVFSFESKKKRVRDDPEMWRMVQRILPKKRARNFSFAVLDLAAKVCISKKPKCLICPINLICDYGSRRIAGRAEPC